MRSCSSCWRSRTSAPASRCFAARAQETVDWLAREMTTEEGAFCASLDADSEGEEGKFYVWSLRRDRSKCSARRTPNSSRATMTSRAEGNFEGHNILNRLSAGAGAAGRREHGSPTLRAKLLAARGAARAPRPRRQSAGRLERPDDRGAGQCRRASRRAVLDPHGGARLHVHRRQDDARRPARPFLAAWQAAVSGARIRLRHHDPRRAGAVRGDRRAGLSRTRADLAGRARSPLCQPRRPAAISSPPAMPKAWWCGRPRPPTRRRPIRTRIAAQNLVRLAGYTGLEAWRDAGRPSVRRICCRSRPRTCSCMWRC